MTKLEKIITWLIVIFLVAGLGLMFLGLNKVKADQSDHKVTICHATSSDTNPYVRIVVDEHATNGHFDNNGTPLAGHEDDILLEGEQDCPGPVTLPPPPCTINCTPPSCTINCTPPPCTIDCDSTPPSGGGSGSGGPGDGSHPSDNVNPSPEPIGLPMQLMAPPVEPQVLAVSTALPRTGMPTWILLMPGAGVGILFRIKKLIFR